MTTAPRPDEPVALGDPHWGEPLRRATPAATSPTSTGEATADLDALLRRRTTRPEQPADHEDRP